MPIKGLTDRGASFPEIGQIRKGAVKSETAPGKDLDYFRVTFDEAEDQTAAQFISVYGNEPDEINILLPFNSVDANFEAWREAYVRGGLIHRCDGEQVLYEINPSTGEKIVVNGSPYKACDGSSACKPTGRLKVIVPELQRLAYLTVLTGSIHDILNISQQLEALLQMRGMLSGIPLKLRRRPREISTPSGTNGKRARRTKHLLSIEADPSWVKKQIAAMKSAALPDNGITDEMMLLHAPEDETDHDADWTVDADVREVQQKPAPAQQPKMSRPHDPEYLKERVQERVQAAGDYEASDKQRGLLRAQMEELFAGDAASEKKYRTVAVALTGVDSTNKMSGAQVKTLLDWIKPSQDDGGAYVPDPMAVKEAHMIEHAVLLDAGQTELPIE